MNCEVEYNIPASIPGDVLTQIFINWEIQFSVTGKGDNIELKVNGSAESMRVEIAGGPFASIKAGSIHSKELLAWAAARELDLTPESINMTREECLEDYFEGISNEEYFRGMAAGPI